MSHPTPADSPSLILPETEAVPSTIYLDCGKGFCIEVSLNWTREYDGEGWSTSWTVDGLRAEFVNEKAGRLEIEDAIDEW